MFRISVERNLAKFSVLNNYLENYFVGNSVSGWEIYLNYGGRRN